MSVAIASGAGATTHAPAARYGTVVFHFTFPRVPLAARSLAILIDGKNPVVADINPALGYAGVVVRAAVGAHTFSVTTFDRPAAGGRAVSTGSTAPATVPAVGQAVVNLSLDGAVASVALALAQTHPTAGFPATIGLQVLARDADGFALLPGTVFAQPVTLTSSNPVDGRLSQTTIRAQPSIGDPQQVTVAYNGANVSRIAFSASGAGLTSVTPTALVPLTRPGFGEQIIITGGENDAFSTAADHQLLTTFGHGAKFSSAAAVDESTRLLYVTNFDAKTGWRFDVYQTFGAHALVDSFIPHLTMESFTIDSVARRLYTTDTNSGDVSIFSTTRGHALLGKIHTGSLCFGLNASTVRVDPLAHQLYVVYGDFDCGGDIRTFSTVAPFPQIKLNFNQPDDDVPRTFGVGAGRLYIVKDVSKTPYQFVDVYDTSKATLLARLGPFMQGYLPSGIAVDDRQRRLYLLVGSTQFPYGYVQSYGLDTGLSFIDAFATSPDSGIVLAPFTP